MVAWYRRRKGKRLLRMPLIRGSGGAGAAHFAQDVVRVVKALAALRLVAELTIDFLRVAAAQGGESAEVFFPDCVADAKVHRRIGLSVASANLVNEN
ncbi:hypothetical protein [Croceicoccus gelatinilyticus]|uniref:hypothetical protein n=1 Tax=Croceicoccus gelatinilyticus TaxID=2835536 RepID=UPI001BCB8BCC|nr:hypothetical protein [Croceicoccus gelatinilyticus]